ncbi:MAG TPA: DUF928 domain-containing protein [Coleofasciculaceae cyanobacterium]
MKSALALACLLLGIISDVEIASAQLRSILQADSKQQKPPVPGRPPEREPAGTRGPCEKTETSFTPLLPVRNTGNRFSGLTLSGHPTFWFYIPYKTSSVRAGEFALEDEQGNSVYQTSFKLPDTPGFVSVNLPTTAKSLEKDKPYRWTFTLYCESLDQAESPPVWHTGTVQRIDMPALETQLKTAILEKRINLYANHNIWYDVSTDLANIHNSPQAWLNLLKVTNLEQLGQAAIAGPVVPIDSKN